MTERILNDRYALEEKVGEGGMAVTWRARDLLLSRIVAVKVMREQFTTDPQFIERFRREAQAAARLSHQHIASVYDTGRADDSYYIVMEFVEGIDLKQRLRQEGALPVMTALEIGRQIAAALDAAHRAGLVHRDIKPHNVLLNQEGKVKVTDFGIAKRTSDGDDDTGVIMGSVHYLSPEQARGEGTTPASDLYSLGAVLYEMLTGRTMFEGENAIAVAHKQIYEKPTLPRQVRPGIPPAVEALVLRCLEKDPRARIQSASEVQAVLTQLMQRLAQEDTVVIPQSSAPSPMDATVIYRAPMTAAPAPATAPQRPRPAPVVEEPRGGSGMTWFLVILFFVLAGGVSYLGMQYLGGPKGDPIVEQKVPVPNIIGKSQEEARLLLTKAGLKVSIQEEPNDAVQVGSVIRQSPRGGDEAEQGASVTFWVSKGAGNTDPMLTMPTSIAGMTTEAAKRVITEAGFKGKFDAASKDFSEEIPEGNVVRTEPAEGMLTPADGTVKLILSKGKKPVEVPIVSKFKDTAPSLGPGMTQVYIAIEIERPDDPNPQLMLPATQYNVGDPVEWEFERTKGEKVLVRMLAGATADHLLEQRVQKYGP